MTIWTPRLTAWPRRDDEHWVLLCKDFSPQRLALSRYSLYKSFLSSIRATGDVADIPEIEDTGSTGEQEPATGELLVPGQESPFPAPLMDTLRGLEAGDVYGVGGRAGFRFLTAAVALLQHELAEAKSELRATRDTLDQTRTDLAESQKDAAVLRERVSTATRGRHVRNVAIALGAALFGIGIEVNRHSVEMSYLIWAIGVVLIAMGWILPRSGQDPGQDQ